MTIPRRDQSAHNSIATNSAKILRLVTGYVISESIYAVTKLGIPSLLIDGPRAVTDLASATDSNADALRRVIMCLIPSGIFTMNGELVAITPLGATLADGATTMRDIVIMEGEINSKLAKGLYRSVRTGQEAATSILGKPLFDWVGDEPGRVAVVHRAMANASNALRAGMFDDYQLPAGTVVADIGGSDGTILASLLAQHPGRRGILFDRPEVVELARPVLAAANVTDRVAIHAGDAFSGVPEADVYVLSMVLHDYDDAQCRRLLGNIAAAGTPGAQLVLIEMVLPENDFGHLARLTDLIMLVAAGGRERTVGAFDTLLASAGFALDRVIHTATPYCFVEATLLDS